MKSAYAIILTPEESGGYLVTVPDLDINTEGDNLADAISMARDAIGLWGICEEDMGRCIPTPPIKTPRHGIDDVVSYVDVDFSSYRKAHESRTIRKNLTIPSWLNEKAEAEGINFSQILQEGLKKRLNL